jgi:thiol-disulfide isomerase/thioredoxin
MIAMDDLQGKVVLLDFWATWCEPCREAMPHIRNVAKKFQGQPLVVLSVGLDEDEEKWIHRSGCENVWRDHDSPHLHD